ncbi:MAG: amidophosphoribosyltransferase [Planctomycetes bacterium]|nr:amidophosphoribosyltransferase [Planctomycetota bacterium]
MREAREACGLFGIVGDAAAVLKTYYGLYSLQHRGQESAGIVSSEGTRLRLHKGMGLVADVFSPATLERIAGPLAMGHVRYSTTGASTLLNAQPLVADCAGGPIAVAHNGNLVNSGELRRELEAHGSIFQTTVDSEIVLHLLAHPDHAGKPDGLARTFRRLRGAFSLLLLTPRELIAVRDPNGFRPLCLGRLGGAYVVASETCAFDLIKANYVRDIEPGEILHVTKDGVRSERYTEAGEARSSFCVFEHVYFARPDSRVFGDTVHIVRMRLGAELAREHPAKADLVMAVPDSGNSAALGYASTSGIPFEQGFIRNHYVGRTFIQPTQGARDQEVEIKLNIVREVVEGKRVVVVDDSIVRGTTARSRVKALREVGAREVHLRVSCPPIRHPCFYGIDFPDPRQLIANERSVPQIRDYLGVDSLGYLSLEGMLRAAPGQPADRFCAACYSGRYPVPVEAGMRKEIFERGAPSCG